MPNYIEALVYKNILLRQQAHLEKDPAKQKELINQADQLRNKAMQLQKTAARPSPSRPSRAVLAAARRELAKPGAFGTRPFASVARRTIPSSSAASSQRPGGLVSESRRRVHGCGK